MIFLICIDNFLRIVTDSDILQFSSFYGLLVAIAFVSYCIEGHDDWVLRSGCVVLHFKVMMWILTDLVSK